MSSFDNKHRNLPVLPLDIVKLIFSKCFELCKNEFVDIFNTGSILCFDPVPRHLMLVTFKEFSRTNYVFNQISKGNVKTLVDTIHYCVGDFPLCTYTISYGYEKYFSVRCPTEHSIEYKLKLSLHSVFTVMKLISMAQRD